MVSAVPFFCTKNNQGVELFDADTILAEKEDAMKSLLAENEELKIQVEELNNKLKNNNNL